MVHVACRNIACGNTDGVCEGDDIDKLNTWQLLRCPHCNTMRYHGKLYVRRACTRCCSSALSQARLCRQQTKSSSHRKPICSLKCSQLRLHQWLITHALAIAASISIDKCNTGTCSARATASRAMKRIIRWHAPRQTHRMAPSGFTNIGQAISIVGGWPAAWQATATCDVGRERCSASRCANN